MLRMKIFIFEIVVHDSANRKYMSAIRFSNNFTNIKKKHPLDFAFQLFNLLLPNLKTWSLV